MSIKSDLGAMRPCSQSNCLQSAHADLDAIQLHPAMLDMATGGAQPLIPGFDATKDFYIPISYGRLVLWKGFSRRIYSHVQLRDAKGQGLAVFDIRIAEHDGSVIVEISEFVMRRLADPAMVSAHRSATRRGQQFGG